MTSKYYKILIELRSCLQQMLNDCQEKNWISLSVNERKREALIKQLESLNADKSTESIALLKEVLACNKELIEAATENKNTSQEKLLEISRKIKQSAFYKQ